MITEITNTSSPHMAAWLCARRDELTDELDRLERDLREATNSLVREIPPRHENDDVIDRLRAAAAYELDCIDAALMRISAGEYGACERCGEPIENWRLRALPQATHCQSCARC